ncbi:sugar transferase [Planococcus shixiaomingii]|uniref:sugar transferase n=1 Tax=Planococcus shixiaomingii TaxID=3058393 RepID=UPI002610F22A|nr:sugar transferase [Planococcus sp. N022]WKA56778.1 sugar transferase [Planococcus sp. N022]
MKSPQLNFEGTSIEKIQPAPGAIYIFSKRSIDVVGAIIGIFLLGIIMLPCSFFYIFGKNKGPIFFKQKRLGKNGEVFEIYKFRSMIKNAEDFLKKDELLYKKYVNNNYKIAAEEDPRITPFGLFIRKTSIDEIPQFINVFKGEMSLVGPRPLVEQELNAYEEKKELFLSAKPGITGFWQVCGRSNVCYPERVDIELHYVQNQSIRLDIEILYKTVICVIKRIGAY